MGRRSEREGIPTNHLGVYTILPSPIVYGIWHTQGGSVGGRTLSKSRAVVLQ